MNKNEIIRILESNAPALLGLDDYDYGYEDGYARAIEVIRGIVSDGSDA